MILGIGHDIMDIRRIEQTLLRFGDRFVQRIFTETERAKAERRRGGGQRNNHIATYAKRFAAKEACAKALGTGFRQGVFHKDMGVVNLPSGQPTLELTGGAQQRLHYLLQQHQLAPGKGGKLKIHVSLSDEYPYASAQVMIELV